MSSFTKPLVVKHIDGKHWEIMETFEYYTDDMEILIIVPAGFITDFASIPKIFWTLIGHPTGKFGKAAVIHDFLYFRKLFDRKKADQIFLEAMTVLGVRWLQRHILYAAVRAFGWMGWKSYREKDTD